MRIALEIEGNVQVLALKRNETAKVRNAAQDSRLQLSLGVITRLTMRPEKKKEENMTLALGALWLPRTYIRTTGTRSEPSIINQFSNEPSLGHRRPISSSPA